MGSNCCKGDAPGKSIVRSNSTYTRNRAGASLDGRSKTSVDSGGVRLTVTAAQIGDSGIYTLQASNAAGKDTARVRLEVSADETPTGDDPPTFLRRLQDLTVKVGTRTRFLVEIASSTECKVTWYRNERRLLEVERIALVRDGHFWCADVAAVSVDDAGRWTCTAENLGGRASCSAHLNVLVPKAYKRPEFMEELRAILTEQGTVSLECKVVGVPTPVLRWFKDSREIKAGDVFALTANSEDPTSLGTYTCEAVNCMGRAYSSSKVHVIGRASREGSANPTSGGITPDPPPIFTKELEDQFVKICESLAFSCHIVVPPWPRSIVWYNKEGKIKPSDKYRVVEDGVGGYMLEVSPAEWCDEGEWKCVATSSGGRVGMSSCYVTMEVPKNYRKPRFMENLQAVLTDEGLVSFECKVVGFPTPILSWFKDGQELKPGDVYQLTGTNSLGSYCCIAKNCMGQACSSAELTVEDIQNQLNEEEKLQLFSKNQAPKFIQGLKSVEAKIDEPFRFTIKVAIPPEPAVLWYRDDQPVDTSSRCLLGKEDRGVFYLEIKKLELMDQTEWKCVAMNDFGHSVTSCFLKLIIPRHYKKPRFLENLQAILSDEGAVNLECKVIGVPQPTLKWYKDGEELKPGDIHRIISGQDGTCCLGTYTCEAQNCMGIAASSASLLGFEDTVKVKNKKKSEEQTLERNLSLSTIHEERTSQLYDTPIGDITLDEKGEISFSFDGKEVSVSLYETPDLTEEEALQIVEMYADQLSENVTEHNVVELPPLRFVKETSTSGNLLMEAIIIDVSPDYFIHPEEDLRTEADIEDISIADENGAAQLSFDKEICDDDLEKTVTLLSEEKVDFLKKDYRRKSDSLRSGDYFSISKEQSYSEGKKNDDDTQVSECTSFASAHSTDKPKSKSSKPSQEDGQESSDITKTVLFREDLGDVRKSKIELVDIKQEGDNLKMSTKSCTNKNESINFESDTEFDLNPQYQTSYKSENIKRLFALLMKSIKNIRNVEEGVSFKADLISSPATASKSLEVINSLLTPLIGIKNNIESMVDVIDFGVFDSNYGSIVEELRNIQKSLTVIQMCAAESCDKTIVTNTCISIINECSDYLMEIMSLIKLCSVDLTDKNQISQIQLLTTDVICILKTCKDITHKKRLIKETTSISKNQQHLNETQKSVFNLKIPINSLLNIVKNALEGKVIMLTDFELGEVILLHMSSSIQDLQTALERIESLSVDESKSSLNNYNTSIINTVMESVLKLRNSFEILSSETKIQHDKQGIKSVLELVKVNLEDISSHIYDIELNVGEFDVLRSDNKLELLQKMAQALISLDKNLSFLNNLPDIHSNMITFHKNLTKVLEKIIESNEAKKYVALVEICDAVNKINSFIKNVDSERTLSLASIGNALGVINEQINNMELDGNLHSILINNFIQLLTQLQNIANNTEDPEQSNDINEEPRSERGTPLLLYQIEKTINAIKHVSISEETTSEMPDMVPILESLTPVLEDLKCSIATFKQNADQESHLSDLSQQSLVKSINKSLHELHQSVTIFNQIVMDSVEILKPGSIVPSVARPIYELNAAIEILQENILSEYDSLSSQEISVKVATLSQALQNCFLFIGEAFECEAVGDISTLDDISYLKTTADSVSSDSHIALEILKVTQHEQNASQFKEFSHESKPDTAIQLCKLLQQDIIDIQSLEVMDTLNEILQIKSNLFFSQLIECFEELHTEIQCILEGVMENKSPVAILNIANKIHAKLVHVDIEQLLLEDNLPITANEINTMVQSLLKLNNDLNEYIQYNVAYDSSAYINTLRTLCRNLMTNIEAFDGGISPDDNFKEQLLSLQDTLADFLNSTGVEQTGARNDFIAHVTEKLTMNLLKLEDELIPFTPESPLPLHSHSILISIDEILKNIENFELRNFTNVAELNNDIVISQFTFESEIESFNHLDSILNNAAKNILSDISESSIADLDKVKDFLQKYLSEFATLRYLMSTRLSHKKVIRLIIQYNLLQNTMNDFEQQQERLQLPIDFKEYLRDCLEKVNRSMRKIQSSMIRLVNFQSDMLFVHPLHKIKIAIGTFTEFLKEDQELYLHELISKFLEVLELGKTHFCGIKLALIEEIKFHNNLKIDNEYKNFINVVGLFKKFVENEIDTINDLAKGDNKLHLQKLLKCFEMHDGYRNTSGVGQKLILLKCINECVDIFYIQLKLSPLSPLHDKILNTIMADILESLYLLNKLCIFSKEKMSDSDIEHCLRSYIKNFTDSSKALEHYKLDNKEFTNTEIALVTALLKEIHLLQDNLRSKDILIEELTIFNTVLDPLNTVEQYLENILSSPFFKDKLNFKNIKDKADSLLYHIEQYIEITEVVDEISAVFNIENIRETTKKVNELKECLLAIQMSPETSTQFIDCFSTKSQARVATELSKCLTDLHEEASNNNENQISTRIQDKMNDVITLLHEDLDTFTKATNLNLLPSNKEGIHQSNDKAILTSSNNEPLCLTLNQDNQSDAIGDTTGKSSNIINELAGKQPQTVECYKIITDSSSIDLKPSFEMIENNEMKSKNPLQEQSFDFVNQELHSTNNVNKEISLFDSNVPLSDQSNISSTQDASELIMPEDTAIEEISRNNDKINKEAYEKSSIASVETQEKISDSLQEQSMDLQIQELESINITQTKIQEIHSKISVCDELQIAHTPDISRFDLPEEIAVENKKETKKDNYINDQIYKAEFEQTCVAPVEIPEKMSYSSQEHIQEFNLTNNVKKEILNIHSNMPLCDQSQIAHTPDNCEFELPTEIAIEQVTNKNNDKNEHEDEFDQTCAALVETFEKVSEVNRCNNSNTYKEENECRDHHDTEVSINQEMDVQPNMVDLPEQIDLSANVLSETRKLEITIESNAQIDQSNELINKIKHNSEIQEKENTAEIDKFSSDISAPDDNCKANNEQEQNKVNTKESLDLSTDSYIPKESSNLQIETYVSAELSLALYEDKDQSIDITPTDEAHEEMNVNSKVVQSQSSITGNFNSKSYISDFENEDPMQRLEHLLQDLNEYINISPENISCKKESLLNILDEFQIVIIKQKFDYDSKKDETLNETLEDLECSVRSVQLQIIENSPTQHIQESAATLQLLVDNLKDIIQFSDKETLNSEISDMSLLKECENSVSNTVEKIERGFFSESDIQIIVDNLTDINFFIKSIKQCISNDTESILDKGVDIMQNLNTIENNLIVVEKQLADKHDIEPLTQDAIITAVHSVYESVSNIRDTLRRIQKKGLYKNYGIPSDILLKTIKVFNSLSAIDVDIKSMCKCLRTFSNHFEDVKFYLNFDKTARLPCDSCITVEVLTELKSNLLGINSNITESDPSLNLQLQLILSDIDEIIQSLETRSNIEVREKIPIFMELSQKLYIIAKNIKGYYENYIILNDISTQIPTECIQSQKIQDKSVGFHTVDDKDNAIKETNGIDNSESQVSLGINKNTDITGYMDIGIHTIYEHDNMNSIKNQYTEILLVSKYEINKVIDNAVDIVMSMKKSKPIPDLDIQINEIKDFATYTNNEQITDLIDKIKDQIQQDEIVYIEDNATSDSVTDINIIHKDVCESDFNVIHDTSKEKLKNCENNLEMVQPTDKTPDTASQNNKEIFLEKGEDNNGSIPSIVCQQIENVLSTKSIDIDSLLQSEDNVTIVQGVSQTSVEMMDFGSEDLIDKTQTTSFNHDQRTEILENNEVIDQQCLKFSEVNGANIGNENENNPLVQCALVIRSPGCDNISEDENIGSDQESVDKSREVVITKDTDSRKTTTQSQNDDIGNKFEVPTVASEIECRTDKDQISSLLSCDNKNYKEIVSADQPNSKSFDKSDKTIDIVSLSSVEDIKSKDNKSTRTIHSNTNEASCESECEITVQELRKDLIENNNSIHTGSLDTKTEFEKTSESNIDNKSALKFCDFDTDVVVEETLDSDNNSGPEFMLRQMSDVLQLHENNNILEVSHTTLHDIHLAKIEVISPITGSQSSEKHILDLTQNIEIPPSIISSSGQKNTEDIHENTDDFHENIQLTHDNATLALFQDTISNTQKCTDLADNDKAADSNGKIEEPENLGKSIEEINLNENTNIDADLIKILTKPKPYSESIVSVSSETNPKKADFENGLHRIESSIIKTNQTNEETTQNKEIILNLGELVATITSNEYLSNPIENLDKKDHTYQDKSLVSNSLSVNSSDSYDLKNENKKCASILKETENVLAILNSERNNEIQQNKNLRSDNNKGSKLEDLDQNGNLVETESGANIASKSFSSATNTEQNILAIQINETTETKQDKSLMSNSFSVDSTDSYDLENKNNKTVSIPKDIEIELAILNSERNNEIQQNKNLSSDNNKESQLEDLDQNGNLVETEAGANIASESFLSATNIEQNVLDIQINETTETKQKPLENKQSVDIDNIDDLKFHENLIIMNIETIEIENKYKIKDCVEIKEQSKLDLGKSNKDIEAYFPQHKDFEENIQSKIDSEYQSNSMEVFNTSEHPLEQQPGSKNNSIELCGSVETSYEQFNEESKELELSDHRKKQSGDRNSYDITAVHKTGNYCDNYNVEVDLSKIEDNKSALLKSDRNDIILNVLVSEFIDNTTNVRIEDDSIDLKFDETSTKVDSLNNYSKNKIEETLFPHNKETNNNNEQIYDWLEHNKIEDKNELKNGENQLNEDTLHICEKQQETELHGSPNLNKTLYLIQCEIGKKSETNTELFVPKCSQTNSIESDRTVETYESSKMKSDHYENTGRLNISGDCEQTEPLKDATMTNASLQEKIPEINKIDSNLSNENKIESYVETYSKLNLDSKSYSDITNQTDHELGLKVRSKSTKNNIQMMDDINEFNLKIEDSKDFANSLVQKKEEDIFIDHNESKCYNEIEIKQNKCLEQETGGEHARFELEKMSSKPWLQMVDPNIHTAYDFSRPPGYIPKLNKSDDFSYSETNLHRNTSKIFYKAQSLVREFQMRSPTPFSITNICHDGTLIDDIRTTQLKSSSETRTINREKSMIMRSDLKGKPVFTTQLTNRTAVAGSRVKLTCSILSTNETRINWYKDDLLLESKQKYKMMCIDGLITLELLNVVPSDSGDYCCTIENESGIVKSCANLKVYPSFEPSPIPPTFTRSIRDKYNSTDNELVLECRIRGQPLPSIKWLKDNKLINTDERHNASYLADGVCRLTISNPTCDDSGNYTCRAENSMWSDQISHYVSFSGRENLYDPSEYNTEEYKGIHRHHVQDVRRPHFTNVLNDYKVVKGGTIGLQVEIGGAPTRVEWIRDGSFVTDLYRNAQTFVDHGIYTLALHDVSETHSGLYTCRAWSKHGNVDMNADITVVQPNVSDGKPAIFVSRPSKDVLITIGEDLNVSFRVQGEPKPKVSLMKGIRDLTNSQRVCKMTSDDYVKFTLKRSVISDAGTYCILAKNAYGCDRAFVTVVVRQRASSVHLISDWTYPIDDSALTSPDKKYKSVPSGIPGEPSVVDGGNNWITLAWPKPEPNSAAPVLAYRVESWLLGTEGGARWKDLGITPRNSFDVFNLKQGEQYHFRVIPRNRYGWGEPVQTSIPVGVVIVGDRPEFTEILPGLLKVLVGETAKLGCYFKGNPRPEIIWMKNGHEIEEGCPRFETLQRGNECLLTIKDVQIDDEGRYSCEASNVHGRASTYSRMAVITDKQIWEADAKLKRERSADATGEFPPQFTMRLRDRRVQSTHPVRLTCQVVGNPTPCVTWYKDGQEIVFDRRRMKYQDEHFHTLEVAPTVLDDGGVYEALARNGHGAVSCRCTLVVDKGIRAYIAPEFCCGLQPLYTVTEGDELRLSAVVEAYPSVGVSWYRDGVRLRARRTAVMTLDRDGQTELALAGVTRRDAGVYTCTAANEVGQASTSGRVEVVTSESGVPTSHVPAIVCSDIPYSKEPMFIKKPRSTEAQEGDTVIIECEVIGDPKPDVYWLRDFLKPDYYRDANHFRRASSGPQYRFEIPHAKLDYTGAYSVVATNVHGEARAVISLQIFAKVEGQTSSDDTHNITYGRVEVIPRFEKELTDLLAYDGDAVEFECQVSGDPEPDITWFHYNKSLAKCVDFESSYELGTARLRITHVTAEDEGSYTCEATNTLGKATSCACLVVYPPGEPHMLSQSLQRPSAMLSAASTPRSTPRSTPARSLCTTPGRDIRLLRSPTREVAPKFYTYPFNKVVEEGDTVVFQCAVAGLPPPWATWDKDGLIIIPSSRITIKEKDEMLRILQIEQVSIDDVGLYRISLENEYGRAEASARLEVISHKGKFYTGVRSYSASPTRSLCRRRTTPTRNRQDSTQ
ncbi:uncharacterized protein LOC126978524 isoform X2 [Leptidea sinapis]|uniref:uncharacterized protein LOC126978524 isoform X2 n=1 Tax=Leptidea sinapis TaxID=189913 RepID=UPI002130995B|nr:uncharacterized protein LOC126978524 isoform X2 [Leptidea sinapis]